MAVSAVYLMGDANLPYSVSVDYDDVAHTWQNARVRNEAGTKARIDIVFNGTPHSFIVPDGTDRVVDIGTFQLVQVTTRNGSVVWGAPNLSYTISFSL